MDRVRAIILDGDQIVVIKREKPDDLYWVFPGGGVEPDDHDLESALKRECMEELGVEIIINDLLIKQEFNDSMEYFYICHIVSGTLGAGYGPEYQIGTGYVGTHEVEKYKIEEIKQLNLKPLNIRDEIVNFFTEISNCINTNNRFGIFLYRNGEFFYKNDSIENIEREYNGYYEIKKHYPVPQLVHKIQTGNKGTLIFTKEETVTKDKGLIADIVIRNNFLAEYSQILELYKRVFLKTKEIGLGNACDVFFKNRVNSRLTKFYDVDFLKRFDNNKFEINEIEVALNTSMIFNKIVDFFSKRRETVTVISQCDPNDLNIGTKPVIFDYLAGGRNPIMAEFATFIWYNLGQGNYLSLKYNKNAFKNHERIFSIQDIVEIRNGKIKHHINEFRKQALTSYFDNVMVPLLENEANISELYIEFVNYLAMKILAVFNVKDMEEKDQLFSIAYLNYFYNAEVNSLDDFKKLIISLWN